MIDQLILDTLNECAEDCFPQVAQHTPKYVLPFFYPCDPSDLEGRDWPLEMDAIARTLESLGNSEDFESSMTLMMLSEHDNLAVSIRTRLATTVQRVKDVSLEIEQLRNDASTRADKLCLEFVGASIDVSKDYSYLGWRYFANLSQSGANQTKCEELSKAIFIGPPEIFDLRILPAQESEKNADYIAEDYWHEIHTAEKRIRRTRYNARVFLQRFVDNLKLIDKGITQLAPSDSSSNPNQDTSDNVDSVLKKDEWQPPTGFVGANTLVNIHKIPRTTLHDWAKKDNPKVECDPRNKETYYQKTWVEGRMKTWNKRD